MRQILGLALAIGSLLWPAAKGIPMTRWSTGSSIALRQSAPDCADGTVIKDLWLVERLNVTYTDNELVRPGNASWTITNNLTKTIKRIDCSLRANYICELESNLGNQSLRLWLQINLDVATFTINQSLPCGSDAASETAYAVGTAVLYLICLDRNSEGNLSCYSDDDGTGFASGSVSLASPSDYVVAL